MVLIFFAIAFLIIINPENNRKARLLGGGVFANFVYFCTTRGKKPTFHEKVVETRDQALQFY